MTSPSKFIKSQNKIFHPSLSQGIKNMICHDQKQFGTSTGGHGQTGAQSHTCRLGSVFRSRDRRLRAGTSVLQRRASSDADGPSSSHSVTPPGKWPWLLPQRSEVSPEIAEDSGNIMPQQSRPFIQFFLLPKGGEGGQTRQPRVYLPREGGGAASHCASRSLHPLLWARH